MTKIKNFIQPWHKIEGLKLKILHYLDPKYKAQNKSTLLYNFTIRSLAIFMFQYF